MSLYASAQQEFVFKASAGAVTEPVEGSWLAAFALYLGATEPNGTWIQTICELVGQNEPINGSWIQALAVAYNITNLEPYANWWLALADGAQPLISWVLETGIWRGTFLNNDTIWTADGIWKTV